MNKMQGLAKVLITILGAYWLITIIFSMFQSVMAVITIHKYNGGEIGFLLVILLEHVFIILIIATILKKRDKIALKIAGSEEFKDVDAQVKWIPFSFRLTSIIAGLYCLSRAATSIPSFLISGFLPETRMHNANVYVVLALLIAGIYLICGAPHFVKWQVKKTMEMCGEN